MRGMNQRTLGLCLGLAVVVACGGGEIDGSEGGGKGGTGGTGSAGAAGMAAAGAAGESGTGGTGGVSDTCWPSHPSCGLSGVGQSCVAWHDNLSSSTRSFRMSMLDLAKPETLAGQFLQDNLIRKNMDLNLPMCFQEGTGLFSWLLEFDTGSQRARTGSAHVQTNPAQGYCYVQESVVGFPTQPEEVSFAFSLDQGKMSFHFAEAIEKLMVVIYLLDDEARALVLPLHQLMVTEGTMSADGNCIGSWNGDGLEVDLNCQPGYSGEQWIHGARVAGYIDVEESETVWIPEMQMTLCVALSGSATTYGEDFEDELHKGKRCARDEGGKIRAAERADWCSATNAACQPPQADAFRFEGAFAASAVKVLAACP